MKLALDSMCLAFSSFEYSRQLSVNSAQTCLFCLVVLEAHLLLSFLVVIESTLVLKLAGCYWEHTCP